MLLDESIIKNKKGFSSKVVFARHHPLPRCAPDGGWIRRDAVQMAGFTFTECAHETLFSYWSDSHAGKKANPSPCLP